MYKYSGMLVVLKNLVKSETAAAVSEDILLIFMLLVCIVALKVFSAVLNVALMKAAGKITGAV